MTDPLTRLLGRPAATDRMVIPADPDDARRIQEARQVVKVAKAARRTAETRALNAVGDTPDAVAERARWDQRLDEAEAALAKAEQQLADLLADVATVTIEMRGIGATAVEDLMAKHPPSKADKDKFRAENPGKRVALQFDSATFPPALLAAVITDITYSDDPDNGSGPISEEQARQLWSSQLPVADLEELVVRAQSLDSRGTGLGDLGKD